jgi:kumamolisin
MRDDPPLFEEAWRALHPPSPPGRHHWIDEPPTEEIRLTEQAPPPYIRYPHAAQPASFNARQVAKAYNAPIDKFDGTGTTVGIIELGGAYSTGDLTQAGFASGNVVAVGVDGGQLHPDPQGADGEVALDIQVVAGVAPGAKIRVYFAPNTDAGFIDAVKLAAAECDTVSISWGGPENQWSPSSIKKFSSVLADARRKGVPVFAASGDNGSTDGTGANVVDYPAADPSAIGCGGTRLMVDATGQRNSETVWNDDPTQSATGGGVSKVFPGRQVPDVAGNADPDTGYNIVVNGQRGVIGGTSAVAPLYAGCYVLVKQAYGKAFDLLNTVLTNPTVCFDVTVGNNGGYKAGPGRDMTTGYGVVDWGRLLTVLVSGSQVPAPGGNPAPPPTPTVTEMPGCTALLRGVSNQLNKFLGGQ